MRDIVKTKINEFSEKNNYQNYHKVEKKSRKIIIAGLFLFFTILIIIGSFFLWKNSDKLRDIFTKDIPKTEKQLVDEQLLEKADSMTLPFIKNAGQKDEQVKFYAPIEKGTVYVNETGITYDTKTTDEAGEHGLAIQEKLLGLDRSPIQLSPEGEAPSQADINYYLSNNREEWKNNLENYQFINFKEVYPKIEFKVRATEKNIEKLFIVDKGGNHKDIKLSFEGIDKLEITQQGELKLSSQDRNLILTAPQAYQYQDGKKKYISVAYELLENNTYGFSVENYDSSKILVIDPMIASTLIGGGEEDRYEFYSSFSTYAGRRNMIQDSTGNIYIVGHTRSDDYPTTLGVYDISFNDADPSFGNDIVISKFNSDLTSLLASTYLGGTAEDNGFAIALDASDNIYVTGFTKSGDFPMPGSPYQGTYQGGDYDVFIAKLSNDLTSLTAATYLGGSGADHNMTMLIDGTDLYLAGDTDSTNFPTTAGVIKTTKEGTVDSFVAKLDLSLSTLTAATFFGGNNADFIKDLEIYSGNLYLAGYTNSDTNFASGTAYSSTYGGGDSDAFVASINTTLTTLNQATYLGGTDLDYAFSLAVTPAGNVVVVGSTKNSFPVTAGVYDATHNSAGLYDGFVSIFSNNLSTLNASTLIGGNGGDEMYDVIADSSNNIFVSGFTASTNYPANNVIKGTGDGLITKFNSDLTQMTASTLIGGTSNIDKVFGLDITADGKILASGITDSTDFPTTIGAYQTNNLGKRDIFISKMDSDLTISQTPHHIQLAVDGTVTPTFRAGVAKTLVFEAKDILNANLLNYNGEHVIRLSGAVNAPDGTVTTCNGINFGSDMTLTFTDGVASCELLAYMANNTQSFDATEIGGSAISSTANAIYDLSPTIQPGFINAAKSIVETPNDNFSAAATVTVRVNPYDDYRNPMGANGNLETPVVNIAVAGSNPATLDNVAFVSPYFQGTYTGTIAGHDYVTATIDGTAVGRDNDPNSAAPYDGSNGSRNILGFDHVELTVGGVNSISGTVDQTYTLQVWAKNSLRETLTGYSAGGTFGYPIYFSGATESPYGFNATCINMHGETINFGDGVYKSFSNGLLTCNVFIKGAQSGTSVEASWFGITSNADAEYDLDLNITPGATDHLNIRETAQVDYHSDVVNKDAGQATNIIVSARDQYGNINTAYSGDHNILFSGATNSYGKSGVGGNIPTVNGDTNAFHEAVPSGTGTTLNFTNGEVTTAMLLYNQGANQIEIEEGTLNSWSSGNASVTLNNLDLDTSISSTGNIDYTKNEITSFLNPNGTCGELELLVITRDQYGNQLEGEHSTAFNVNLNFDPTSTNNAGVTTPLLVNNNDGSFSYSYVAMPGLDKLTGTVDSNAIVSDFYPGTPIAGDLGSDGTYLQEINSGYNKRTWTGAVSSDWDNPANWAEGTTPLYCSYVVIASENYLGTSCSGAICQPTVNLSTGVKEIQGLYLGKSVDPFAVAPFDIETTPHTYHNVDADGDANLTMSQASLTNYLKVNDDLIIYEKGLITHTANTTTQTHIVNIETGDDFTTQASDLDASGIVDADEKGEIDVSAKGYQYGSGPGTSAYCPEGPGGGSYGGRAGAGTQCGAGWIYGSLTQPSDLGSGGANDYTHTSGSGGGFIKLNISGNSNISGSIIARGGNNGHWWAAGGSGGGIFLTTNSLSGTGGTIAANGGTGARGGGGGGGRIAVYYTTDTSAINYQAFGSSGGLGYGGAGTIYKKEGNNDGDLIIDNNNQDAATDDRYIGRTPIIETIDFRDIIIRNYGNLDIQPTANVTHTTIDWSTKGIITDNGGNFDLLSGGGSLEIPATSRLMANTSRTFSNLAVNGVLSHSNNTTTEQYKLDYTVNGDCNVNTGGVVDVSYRGYQSGYGPGYTASVGASYGGSGGGNSKLGYGSITAPNNIGSGGNNFGGGAIKLSVSGTLNNSSGILANGIGTAGGSGGSIWVDTQVLAGTDGTFFANGGNGSTYGGGGGRIAVHYTTDTSTNSTYQAFGGTGTYFGGAGTIYKKDKDDLSKPNGDLVIDNNSKSPLNNYVAGKTYFINPGNDNFDSIIVQKYGYLYITPETNATYVNLDWDDYGVIGDNGGTFELLTGGGDLTVPATAMFYENYIRTFDNYTIDGFMETTVPISTVGNFNVGGTMVTTFPIIATGDFNIGSVGTVTHMANATTQQYILDITANNLSIASGGKIDVSAKGYRYGAGPGTSPYIDEGPGGGSYGGKAGAGTQGSAGSVYGSLTHPSDLGSGGGNDYTHTSGSGGGFVKLNISGNSNISGSIIAQGGNYGHWWAAGGSGGGIFLTTNSLSGVGGIISANGGIGARGGGGGGGRIAVHYITDTSNINYQTYGNSGGLGYGGAGTVYLSDTDNPENNKLIIDNNGISGPETQVGYNVTQTNPFTVPIAELYFNNNAKAVIKDGATLDFSATNNIINDNRNFNTKLLLHADGVNSSTAFTDSSFSPHAFTAFGNAQISTAQSKFGGSSAYFDGTGDYIETADSADWDFSGDFTVDFWAKHNAVSTYNTFLEIGSWTNSLIVRQDSASSFCLHFNNVSYCNSYTTNLDWHHYAIARSGGIIKLFIDGVQIGSDISNSTNFQPASVLRIGSSVHATGQYLNGYIDEFRVSRGTARWTSNFTPPTSEYIVTSEGWDYQFPTNSYLYHEAGSVIFNPDTTITNFTFLENSGANFTHNNVTIGVNGVFEQANYHYLTDSPLTFDNLTIASGGTLTHSQNTTELNPPVNSIYIKANNLDIQSGGKIDVSTKGWNVNGTYSGTLNSGAGHGGIGGASSTGTGGAAYDSGLNPSLPGSRGFGGGSGGGSARIIVDNSLTNNGDINANGATGAINTGGGSGGSVLISAKDLNGGGNIFSKGGNTSGTGGSGAGGRIAVYYENKDDYTGSTPLNTDVYAGGIGGNASGSIGTFYMASADHYTISGSTTQTAGSINPISIYLKDENNNDYIYDGVRNLTFSGANASPNGTAPICTNNLAANINFGLPTEIDFLSGQAHSDMTLFDATAPAQAEIDTSDGTFSTAGDTTWDLDVTVNSGAIEKPKTILDIIPNPADISLNQTANITVTTYDTWDNQMTSGGEQVDLNLTGNNGPLSFSTLGTADHLITDNNNGTYTTSFVPTLSSEDLISGTIGTDLIDILHDTDHLYLPGETDDGIYRLLSTDGGASHYQITGSSSQTAGTTQTITISAKDDSNFTMTNYTGQKTIRLSGAENANTGEVPTCLDYNNDPKQFGQDMVLNFTSGQATCQMTLYKDQTPDAHIDATEQGGDSLTSTANVTYGLDVDVVANSANLNQTILSATPNPINITLQPTETISVLVRDQYQNNVKTGTETVTADIDLANDGSIDQDNVSLTDADQDGIYTTTYNPIGIGTDLITTQVNAASVIHDNDGTSDGNLYVSVTVSTYTVTFQDWDNTVLKTETVNHGADATPPANPSRTGYTFTSWDNSYTNITANTTITAQYAINTYTVTFDKNGGDTEADPTTKTANFNTTIDALPTEPTRANHTFSGWNTNADGSGTTFIQTTPVTDNLTVYALWDMEQFTLVYNPGANGTITGNLNQTVTYGGSGTEVVAVPNTGYHFTQWGDGVMTPARTDTNVTADLNVVASFAINTYTVTFQDWDNTVLKTETVNHGADATAPANPTRVGYTFTSWDNSYTNVTANLTVTAQYTINTYTVTFQDWDNTVLKTETVNHGADATAPANPTRVGYTFTAWDNSYTNVTANITITAQYAINTHTVTFDKNGGDTEADPTTKTANFNTTIDALPASPVRNLHTFSHWNTQADGAGNVFDITTLVMDNITVYAIWVAINQYTLIYTANSNGTILGESPQVVIQGGNGTEVEAIANTGYHFTSWSDGVLTAKRTDLNVTGNISVSASFAQNEEEVLTINPPSDLKAKAISKEEIELSWIDNSDNETDFQLERKKEGDDSFKLVKTISPNKEDSTDDNLDLKTKYTYRIRAINSLENLFSDYSNEASDRTEGAEIKIESLVSDCNVITLKVSTDKYYKNEKLDFEIELKANNQEDTITLRDIKADEKGDASLTLESLIQNTAYEIKVRFKKDDEDYSDWSEKEEASTLLCQVVTADLPTEELREIDETEEIREEEESQPSTPPISSTDDENETSQKDSEREDFKKENLEKDNKESINQENLAPETPSSEIVEAVVNGVADLKEVAEEKKIEAATISLTAMSLSAATLATGLGSLAEARMFLGAMFALFLGIYTKKRKDWGVVFDSYSGKPIPLASVSIYDEKERKVDQKLTDASGAYSFLVPPGKYRLEAKKNGYIFDPQDIQVKVFYSDQYQGEQLTIEKDDIIKKDIPMVPIKKNYLAFMQRFDLKSFLWKSFFIAGFLFSFAVLLLYPNLWNYFIFSLYVLSVILSHLMLKKAAWGKILNEQGKMEAFATIKIFDRETDQLKARTISDEKGRYFLILDQGSYTMEITLVSGKRYTQKLYFSQKAVLQKKVRLG
ncbi:MAG: InlB B-repeat-containing protein [Candidatus Moraniibacteriota bacterium]